jgi:hypothetical protein
LSELDNFYIFASELELSNVVTFVFVANYNDTVTTQQQLTLNLCSAQYQQHALGLDDGYVFGATVIHKSLTMYCSQWDQSSGKIVHSISFCSFIVLVLINGEKVVNPVFPDFVLDSFPNFIQCYIFLCKIAEHLGDEVNKVFKEWDTEDGRSNFKKRSQNTSTNRPW